MGREHRSERKRDYDKEHSPVDETANANKKRSKKEKNRSVSPVRSRSHTYSPSPRREISPKRRPRSRSRSRDLPASSRYGGYYGSRRFYDGRDNPNPCPCLGVFGMSLHTTERDLKHLFGRYGEVESVQIVYDRYSGRSRGFGFVYFTSTKDATRAKDNLVDAVIDGMKVRVDYSVTRGGGPYSGNALARNPIFPSRHMRRSISRSPVRNRSRSPSRSRSRSESR